jgi:hypothetical protein
LKELIMFARLTWLCLLLVVTATSVAAEEPRPGIRFDSVLGTRKASPTVTTPSQILQRQPTRLTAEQKRDLAEMSGEQAARRLSQLDGSGSLMLDITAEASQEKPLRVPGEPPLSRGWFWWRDLHERPYVWLVDRGWMPADGR